MFIRESNINCSEKDVYESQDWGLFPAFLCHCETEEEKWGVRRCYILLQTNHKNIQPLSRVVNCMRSTESHPRCWRNNGSYLLTQSMPVCFAVCSTPRRPDRRLLLSYTGGKGNTLIWTSKTDWADQDSNDKIRRINCFYTAFLEKTKSWQEMIRLKYIQD